MGVIDIHSFLDFTKLKDNSITWVDSMVIFVLNVWLCFQEKLLYMDKLGNIFFPRGS